MRMDEVTARHRADVLVVGGGSAGLWTAIRAADFCSRVVLVDKGVVASSGVSTFIHVVTAPVSDSELMLAMREIVERSTYLVDQVWLETLLRELGPRLRDMEEWGVPFERDASGRLATDRRMGQVATSSAFVNGRPMMQSLKERALARGVVLVERVMVTDLLTSDGQHPSAGRVIGAVGFHTVTGQPFVFSAGAVVLTSGIASAKLHVAYTDGVTGDGQAMALRAGAELENLEMGTTPIFPIWERKFSTGGSSEYMRLGARVVNRDGEDIVSKYSPNKAAPFLTRIQLCQAAAREAREGRGPIRFDMRHLKDEDVALMRRILPSAMKAFDEEGIDLQKQAIETTPMVPYWFGGGEGGIRIDLHGRSSLPGLYAAGCSTHFAANYSYIVGIVQSYGFVSGCRAGEEAGRTAADRNGDSPWEEQVRSLLDEAIGPSKRATGRLPGEVYRALHRVTVPLERSLFCHGTRIAGTLAEVRRVVGEELRQLRAGDVHELVKANEVRSFATVAEAVYRCALERKESRLGFYREDFPYRDDIDWLRWTIVRRGPAGLTVRTEPVPVESYPVKLMKRERVPALIQFTR